MFLRLTAAGAALALLSTVPAIAAGDPSAAAVPAAAAATSPSAPAQPPAASEAAPGVPRASNGFVELFGLMAAGAGAKPAPTAGAPNAAAAPAPTDAAAKTLIVIPAAPKAEPKHAHRSATRRHLRRHYASRHRQSRSHETKAATAAPPPAAKPAAAPPEPLPVPVKTIAVQPEPARGSDVQTGRAATAAPGEPPPDAVSRRFQKASAGAVTVTDPTTLRMALSAAGQKIAAKRHHQTAPGPSPAQ
ncbi:MAG TPA: hypothetical protein VHD15_04430 [Hyphomicrobiales bacterium]|nr:hypothetical protein [Hyphomicrobiales bacterium]